jgi:hypothetical protein
MSKEKNLEAILVICLALIVFYLILDIRILLLISVILGLASLFIPFVAKWVAKAWYGLSHVMGFVMSKVILSIIFFIFLYPMALIARAGGKLSVRLKKAPDSYWTLRNHSYKKEDLENMW